MDKPELFDLAKSTLTLIISDLEISLSKKPHDQYIAGLIMGYKSSLLLLDQSPYDSANAEAV